MAVAMMTPRDKLQRLVDLGRKTWRYAWLVAVFALAGIVLSVAFALFKPKKFQSYAVLFYQERIQTSLLSNREEQVQRNIGDRYRELLLARGQLAQIVEDKKLNPFPDEPDEDVAIDKLRQAVKFEARGANAFRITFTDSDAERAKNVTEKLTQMLQVKDEDLRNEQAKATVTFALKQKDDAQAELSKMELALAQFLAKHPEFAQDSAQPVAAGSVQGEGASIRAASNQKKEPVNTGNMRLYALERQRQRMQARLDAPPDAPPIRIPSPQTPEKIAAEAEVAQARNELASANRELTEAMSQYTEQHPAVMRAKDRVAAAKAKLGRAQSSVPPDVETAVAPATEADREKLRKELKTLEDQISAEQKRGDPKASAAISAADATTNWVVQLETDHAKLRRDVTEGRERVEALADSVFRAEMDANQKLAETGGRLSVVDPAFKPVKPSGPGKTVLVIAGLALFLARGAGLALGLAVIDDRLYRRSDLEELGLAVLAVIPPSHGARPQPATKKPAKRAA
jgi:succinoglycan biosynthesis transport protein ExoP